MRTKNSPNPVPCGKCPDCRGRKVSAWSFRLMQQSKISASQHFITLTYDTEHVPITPKGFMGLTKRDPQLFFKRLRKTVGKTKTPIKYFLVGEYGGKSYRPHYHIILFNAPMELLQDAWQLGAIHYGQLTEASVGYTLKYLSKPRRIPLHRNDDRLPEFSLMSKGLGKNYLSQAVEQWHKNDLVNRMHCNLTDGKKISMPRYYKDKLYSNSEREIIAKSSYEKFMNEEKQRYENSSITTQADKKAAIKAAFEKMNQPCTKNKI